MRRFLPRVITILAVVISVLPWSSSSHTEREWRPVAANNQDWDMDTRHHPGSSLHKRGRRRERRAEGARTQHAANEVGQLSVTEETNKNVGATSCRVHLNALVAETAEETSSQLDNVAFVKTHKTASTTVAAILYRYARRHHIKLAHFGRSTSVRLEVAAAKTVAGHEPVDIMHYHISGRGKYSGSWPDALKRYQQIMRDPDNINFVTVLREPRSHLLSYYYYYLEPDTKLSIGEFLLKAKNLNDEEHSCLLNPLSAEFGVKTADEMQHLVDDVLPSFKLIMLTERLDEGLLVLRHLLHWQLIDLTYMTLNETKGGSRRWDGKPFVDRPQFDDLPKEVRDRIDELTELDQVLYDAGKKEFEKRLAHASKMIESDLVEFQELQREITTYLDGNSSSMANKMYRSMDVYNKAPPLYAF